MKLKEFEAKQLLRKVGISTSQGIIITSSYYDLDPNLNKIPKFSDQRLIKLQTLMGGRGKAGGIIPVQNREEAQAKISQFLNQTFLNEEIKEILLDEKIEIKQEFYLGIIFDTFRKCPMLIFSEEGGVDIEELQARNPEKIVKIEIDYLRGITLETLKNISLQFHETIQKLYTCFTQFECKMIEINPLVLTTSDRLIAVDGAVILDDNHKNELPFSFLERTSNRSATKREKAAREIDRNDHRGVAGKTFLDLDGDIAILTSGGGASLTLMDALQELGGKPANFTEYSGNPPAKKVERLTRIVIDRENISGLLIAGVIANFTDIAETIKAIVNVLQEKRPHFPIVIRRAGPNDQEAKRILKEARKNFGLDLHYFDENTPLTKAVEIMVKLSEQYKSQIEYENKPNKPNKIKSYY